MIAVPGSRRVLACAFGCVVAAVGGFILFDLVFGSFAVGGSGVVPVSRGITAPVDVQFTNRYDFPISVSDLTITVIGVHAPRADHANPCHIRDFAVEQISTTIPITIGARATSTLTGLNIARNDWPRVGIFVLAADRDGCMEASLTLSYSASRHLAIL